MKRQALLGMPILDPAAGRILGHVRDVYLNRTGEVVAGLRVERSGWLRGSGFVPLEALVCWGPRVLAVRAACMVRRDGTALPDTLYGSQGQFLGRILDVDFDAAGRIAGICLSRALREAPIYLPAGSGYVQRDARGRLCWMQTPENPRIGGNDEQV